MSLHPIMLKTPDEFHSERARTIRLFHEALDPVPSTMRFVKICGPGRAQRRADAKRNRVHMRKLAKRDLPKAPKLAQLVLEAREFVAHDKPIRKLHTAVGVPRNLRKRARQMARLARRPRNLRKRAR